MEKLPAPRGKLAELCARPTMGSSGSRLSKELLAEYQVRGTPVPGSLRAGRAGEPGLGSRIPGPAAERAWPPGGSLNPFRFAFQDLTFLTKQEILL